MIHTLSHHPFAFPFLLLRLLLSYLFLFLLLLFSFLIPLVPPLRVERAQILWMDSLAHAGTQQVDEMLQEVARGGTHQFTR